MPIYYISLFDDVLRCILFEDWCLLMFILVFTKTAQQLFDLRWRLVDVEIMHMLTKAYNCVLSMSGAIYRYAVSQVLLS
jgi:hypothetical protein